MYVGGELEVMDEGGGEAWGRRKGPLDRSCQHNNVFYSIGSTVGITKGTINYSWYKTCIKDACLWETGWVEGSMITSFPKDPWAAAANFGKVISTPNE